MREKSVLLTTLGSSGDDRLDYQYFYYDNQGHLTYCNSLSVAEAGTKYILSQNRTLSFDNPYFLSVSL